MDRVQARVAFIGDEVSALGFRLAGVDVHTPAPGEGSALFARLRREAALILLTQEALAWVGEGALQAALRAGRPLVLVIPDVRGRQQPPDIGASIRRQLGWRTKRMGWSRGSQEPGAPSGPGRSTHEPRPHLESGMNVEESAKNLLKLVEGYRSQECREAMDKARGEAAEILRRAWRREREHLHASVQAERSRARALIQAAQAERATRERASGDRQNAVLLAEAWPRLRALLLARWRDPAGRETWVAGALDQARTSLPPGPWTARHAPDWAPPEAPGASLALVAGPKDEGRALRFLADPGIAAGLIVEGGAAVLDASLEGLLADRQRIEARLLALLAAREAGHRAASATAAAGLASPPADHRAVGAAPGAEEHRP